MSTKSHKLFVVKDNTHPDSAPRLIKGESRSQVAKFLAASVSIEAGDGLEAAQILKDHPNVMLEDATLFAKDIVNAEGQSPSGVEDVSTPSNIATDVASTPASGVSPQPDGTESA